MQPFCKFSTQSEAEAALMHALSLPDWIKIFCTDKQGRNVSHHLDKASTCKIARYSPCGMFDSEEAYEAHLKKSIEANLEKIAKFMVGRGPLRTISTEFDHAVGQLVRLEEDGTFSLTPCFCTHLALSRNREDKTGLGFYISDFAPIL